MGRNFFFIVKLAVVYLKTENMFPVSIKFKRHECKFGEEENAV